MEIIYTASYQPDIILSGLRIGQPMMVITDLLVAAVCLYGWRVTPSQPSGASLCRLFFLFTGLSMVVSAFLGHAFTYILPRAVVLPGWLLGVLGVSAMEQSAIERTRHLYSTALGKTLSWLNIAKAGLAFWFVSSTLWFPAVEIHAAAGMLLTVAPLEAFLRYKTGDNSSKHVLYGIGLLLLAVSVFMVKKIPSPWMGYTDIAHVVMSFAMWQIALGGRGMNQTVASAQKS
ncbi:MAG: DUF6962 family protein [Bacteroidota bacterium]